MTSQHSTDLISRSLPLQILQQRSHIRRTTQSVYARILCSIWPGDIDRIKIELDRKLDRSGLRLNFNKNELQQLSSDLPENFDVYLLYKLLQVALFGGIGVPQRSFESDTLEECLQTSRHLYIDVSHMETFESLEEKSFLLKDKLLQFLTKVEDSTKTNLSETKQEVLEEFPLSFTLPTVSNSDIFSDIFATLLQSTFIVVFEYCCPHNLTAIKNHLLPMSHLKKVLPKNEILELKNSTSIRELGWGTMRSLVMRFGDSFLGIDEEIVHSCMEIKNVRNTINHSLTISDIECHALTNNCYQAVEVILRKINSVHGQDIEALLVQLAPITLSSTMHPTPPPDLSQTSASGVLSQETLVSNPPHPKSTSAMSSLQLPLSTAPISDIPGPPATISNIPQSASSPLTSPSSSPPPTTCVLASSQSQETFAPSHSSPVASAVPSTSSQSSIVQTVPSALEPCTSYTQEDMNVTRVFCALRKGGPAVRTFAKVFELLFPEGLSRVISYCKDILNYSGKMMKSFTPDEKKHISENTPLCELDITLLYKVIGKVCSTTLGDPEQWKCPSNHFGHLLYRVKGVRNFQSHEVVVYTNHDLAKVADNLKDCLKKIIELLGQETGVDLSDIQQEIIDELHKIFTDPLPMQSFQDYRKWIKTMHEELAQETMMKARKELQRYYDNERLRIVNPVTWYHNPDTHDHSVWDVSDLYTELEIKDVMGHSNLSSVVTRDILTLLTPQTNILVIEGAAGSGKTSICKFLLQCWKCNVDTKVKGLVEVDLMIYIQCRHVRSESLVDFFTQNLLRDSLYPVERSNVILSLSDARILFVIDGYDEADYKARNIVQEALVKFPSSSAIITTRPEFRPEIDLMINSCRSSGRRILLTVNGFGDHNRFVYIHKLFHQMGEDPDGFLIYLESVDAYLGSFTRLPLTLALLSLTWVKRTENFTTDMMVTQLYQRIVDLFLNRFIDRQRQRPGETRHQKDIKRKASKWLDTLGKVAWDGIQEGRTHLNDSEETLMRDKSDELGIDATEGLSCLLQCQISATSMEDEMMWEFIHKSVQEYLSALDRFTVVKESKETFDKALNLQNANDYNAMKKYIHLIEFIAGICAEKKCLTKEVAKQLLHILQVQTPWAFDAICSLSRECRSSSAFMECLKGMFDGHTLLETLEDHNVVHMHYILQQTSLGLPTSVSVILNSEDIRKSKDLVDLLLARGCYPQLHVRVSGPQCVQSTVAALRTFKNPSQVAVIFHIQRNDTFTDLLNLWPWEILPLVLEFPYQVFSLLWLQFSACMAASNIRPSRVEYVGNPDGNRAVEYLCTALKAELVLCHPGSSAQITIFGRVTSISPSTRTSKH